MDKKIFLLLGASGTGKTTLGNYLKKIGIIELISCTTRKPRENEIPGITYYYLSNKKFDKIKKVETTKYAGNRYCISKKEVNNKLKNGYVFAIVDKGGIEQFKNQYGNMVKVIYIYSNMMECFNRIKKRDNFNIACKRIKNAMSTGEFKNNKLADYVIINKNGCLNKSKKMLKEIIKIEGYSWYKIFRNKIKNKIKELFKN